MLRRFEAENPIQKLENIASSHQAAARTRQKKNIAICRRFASLRCLKSHVAIYHRSTLRRHVCLQCGSNYATRAALISHKIKKHENLNLNTKVKKALSKD